MSYPPNKRYVPVSMLGNVQHRCARASIAEAKRALLDALGPGASSWPAVETHYYIMDRATKARAVEPGGER